MSGLVLVSTIFAAMSVGVLSGFAALSLFFALLSRNRQSEAPLPIHITAKA